MTATLTLEATSTGFSRFAGLGRNEENRPRPTMTNETPSILRAVAAENRGGPLSRTFFIARIIAIGAAVGGAVPTLINIYHSWQNDIPFTEVSHRLAQSQLWSKNYDCKIDYRTLTTTNGTRVDVGACQRSGDISLKISASTGQASYEWISFAQLQKPAKAAAGSLLDLFVSTAEAAEPPPGGGARPPAAVSAGIQVAQAGMQVMCTAIQPGNKIVRIVNEGGKCFRETFSPVVGKVERREEVPCNTQCPR